VFRSIGKPGTFLIMGLLYMRCAATPLRRLAGRYRRPRLIAALAALLVVSASADAAYVYFYRVFGDWSLVCALDEPSGRRTCALSAPIPQLAAPRSVVDIRSDGGGWVVLVRVLAGHRDDAPIYLRVDDHEPHQAKLDRFGHATWNGADAAAIVDEMKDAEGVVVRSFAGAEGQPRDEFIAADQFSAALEACLARLRGDPIDGG